MSAADVPVLICAPADFPITIAGSTFDHVCADCGAALMLAPTGQQFLREHPETRLLCILCIDIDAISGVGLPASVERMTDDLMNIEPNLRRGRN